MIIGDASHEESIDFRAFLEGFQPGQEVTFKVNIFQYDDEDDDFEDDDGGIICLSSPMTVR